MYFISLKLVVMTLFHHIRLKTAASLAIHDSYRDFGVKNCHKDT